MIPSTEYTVGYSGNRDVGTATVTVSDVAGGNYQITTATQNFTITKRLLSSAVVSVGNGPFTYNGQDQKPSVTVTYKGETVPSDEYTVAYPANKNAGQAAVTVTAVTGKNYEGSNSAAFTISNIGLLKTSSTGAWIWSFARMLLRRARTFLL